MLLKESISEITKDLTLGFFTNYFERHSKKKKIKTNNQLDIIFPSERRAHGLIQSLSTAWGTVVWENLAKQLSLRNGYEVLDAKNFNKSAPKLSNDLVEKIGKLSHSLDTNLINFSEAFREIKEISLIHSRSNPDSGGVPGGMGIDLWLKKGNLELMTDIKSPQENVGNFKKLSKHMLTWASHRFSQIKACELEVFISLPYNPFPNREIYMQQQGNKIPDNIKDRFYLENDFWDLISGEKNTKEKIWDGLKDLSKSPELLDLKSRFI